MSMRVLLAKERILKIIQVWDEKQIKPWSLLEFLLQLSNDSQIIDEILIQLEEKAILEVSNRLICRFKKRGGSGSSKFYCILEFSLMMMMMRSINYSNSQIPPSIAITPVLPTLEPEDSLIMGNEELSTIPEKESDEFIKSSVEDLVPIPSESEDTSESDSDCDLPSCDDFSPINVYEEKSVTFSNPLFDSNDDFTSSDDESLSDEDVPEDNVKIYSNPLFEFDDEYISSDVNPLFDEVLENIESKDSYVSNLDEPALLVTPLSDFNEDECFDPGGDVDEIELLLHRDPSTPKISVASILEGFTDEPPLEENDDLFDLESKENEWKKILYDAPIDDLMTKDKVFDPGIHETNFSPTYVRLPFEGRHYLSLTYVIRIFLPYFTYPVESSLPLSSESKDIIFDPDISAFHFSSLEPVAYKCLMEVCSFTCFVPNITMIWGESS
ncbi:hypothetical protein Tco_1404712 [Tanacetum coccineum]